MYGSEFSNVHQRATSTSYHIHQTALKWAGAEVAPRILFMDTIKEANHVARRRVADLSLDIFEVYKWLILKKGTLIPR